MVSYAFDLFAVLEISCERTFSGLYYYVYLVSTGPSKPPDGMAEGWTDPDPLSSRLLSLFKWILLVAFQVS